MNNPNVEALYAILAEVAPMLSATTQSDLAIRLASRGVLAPSALSAPDNWRLNSVAAVTAHGAVIAREGLIAELERIAKGETA
jgi:hypothetical protein